MACLSLALLGTLDVTCDGQPVTGFVTDKVRALLVYLAMEADRAHRRDTLAELLWPEQPAQVARNSLRQALATLRQAIGDRTAAPPFLHISAETIQFNAASDHWLDVTAFTRLLDACRQHPHDRLERCTPCAQRLEQAVALYRGSFLDQFVVRDSVAFEEWTLLHRERLRRHAVTALARLTTYYERRGLYDVAEPYAWQQVEADPWREEGHRQLMRVLALSGQRSAALRQYAICRRVLQDELGVTPAPETDALYEQIRDGTLDDSVAPRRAAPQLPTAPTSFIGRRRERADLASLLTDRTVRLVTLVGAPGIGKTRLALAVAAELAGDFEAGAAFVALAPISDWELVVPTIAQVLGVGATGDRPVLDTLIGVLRAQSLLLLLDNLEQVLAAGPHIAALLAACPPLTRPRHQPRPAAPVRRAHGCRSAAGAARQRGTSARWQVTQSEAGALFITRATAVAAHVAITEATAPAIAAICTRLDGLPLAIELAAARSTLLAPHALLARLEHRLALLTGGARDLPPRQQTLRATIDWSYQLLRLPSERCLRVWPCSLAAGRSKPQRRSAAGQGVGNVDVLDGLDALVEQHLVQQDTDGAGQPWYRMVETIREYAHELLAARSDAEVVARRYAAYYVAFAETADEALAGPEQGAWLDRLERDQGNLRAVLRWAVAQRKGEVALRVAAAQRRFWFRVGNIREGIDALEAALALPGAVPARVRITALLAAADLVSYGRNQSRGQAYYAAALALAEARGDQHGMASAMLYLNRREESLGRFQQLGDMRGTARALTVVGTDLRGGETARRRLVAARDLFVQLGDLASVANNHQFLGRLVREQGEYAQADALFAAGVALAREVRDHSTIAWMLQAWGELALIQGDDGAAQARLEESIELFRHRGIRARPRLIALRPRLCPAACGR